MVVCCISPYLQCCPEHAPGQVCECQERDGVEDRAMWGEVVGEVDQRVHHSRSQIKPADPHKRCICESQQAACNAHDVKDDGRLEQIRDMIRCLHRPLLLQ